MVQTASYHGSMAWHHPDCVTTPISGTFACDGLHTLTFEDQHRVRRLCQSPSNFHAMYREFIKTIETSMQTDSRNASAQIISEDYNIEAALLEQAMPVNQMKREPFNHPAGLSGAILTSLVQAHSKFDYDVAENRRAACIICFAKFQPGERRIGTKEYDKYIFMNWYHIECYFTSYMKSCYPLSFDQSGLKSITSGPVFRQLHYRLQKALVHKANLSFRANTPQNALRNPIAGLCIPPQCNEKKLQVAVGMLYALHDVEDAILRAVRDYLVSIISIGTPQTSDQNQRMLSETTSSLIEVFWQTFMKVSATKMMEKVDLSQCPPLGLVKKPSLVTFLIRSLLFGAYSLDDSSPVSPVSPVSSVSSGAGQTSPAYVATLADHLYEEDGLDSDAEDDSNDVTPDFVPPARMTRGARAAVETSSNSQSLERKAAQIKTKFDVTNFWRNALRGDVDKFIHNLMTNPENLQRLAILKNVIVWTLENRQENGFFLTSIDTSPRGSLFEFDEGKYMENYIKTYHGAKNIVDKLTITDEQLHALLTLFGVEDSPIPQNSLPQFSKERLIELLTIGAPPPCPECNSGTIRFSSYYGAPIRIFCNGGTLSTENGTVMCSFETVSIDGYKSCVAPDEIHQLASKLDTVMKEKMASDEASTPATISCDFGKVRISASDLLDLCQPSISSSEYSFLSCKDKSITPFVKFIVHGLSQAPHMVCLTDVLSASTNQPQSQSRSESQDQPEQEPNTKRPRLTLDRDATHVIESNQKLAHKIAQLLNLQATKENTNAQEVLNRFMHTLQEIGDLSVSDSQTFADWCLTNGFVEPPLWEIRTEMKLSLRYCDWPM